MKPLTKTVASRSGGIAARFVALTTDPSLTVANATTTDTVRVTTKELAKLRKRGLLNDTVANPVANKPRYVRWREANPELYKQRQAEYMRKMRAKEKK